MKAPLIIICAMASLALSCRQKNKYPTTDTAQVNDGKLIPMNFVDSNYSEIANYAHDTVTKDGWSINYFVKNDSTRYKDIYIKWSKGQQNHFEKYEDILELRSYFIPHFVGENGTHLFMESACGTSCLSLITISKNSVLDKKQFGSVINYDINKGLVAYIPYKAERSDTLTISIFDLARNIEKLVTLKGRCNISPQEGCIDSVYFNKKYVKIFATAEDEKGQPAKEQHTLNLTK